MENWMHSNVNMLSIKTCFKKSRQYVKFKPTVKPSCDLKDPN